MTGRQKRASSREAPVMEASPDAASPSSYSCFHARLHHSHPSVRGGFHSSFRMYLEETDSRVGGVSGACPRLHQELVSDGPLVCRSPLVRQDLVSIVEMTIAFDCQNSCA